MASINRLGFRVAAAASLFSLSALTILPAWGNPDKETVKTKPVAFSQAQVTFYEKEVQPILEANCLKCHNDKKVRGGLRLTSRALILKGGDTGPAVNLDKPNDSHLLKAINFKELEMPPTGKLPDKEIDILTRWVKEGLPWTPGEADKVADAHQGEHKGGVVTEEAKRFWAYQPLKRPPLPEVKNKGWVQAPTDTFLLAKLEEKQLTPAPPADRVALLRRTYYNLIGLPPTPEEVDHFVSDTSPDAFAKVVDKLLASPQYGEKWGRHWLDLVHFAETNGYERDGPKPNAYRYRDYVIRSFNSDKPYDQFIREQIAGDELPANGEYNPDPVIATGYYRLGLWQDEPVDALQSRYDELDDVVATTAQTFLAMTMNCARCHDHKIDPIPQTDYYRLLAFFEDIPPYSDTRNVSSKLNQTDITPPERRQTYEKELAERQAKMDKLKAEATAIEEEAIKKMPAEDQRASEGPDRPQVVLKVPGYLEPERKEEYNRVRRDMDLLRRKPVPHQELALSVNHCSARPAPVHVMIRGNANAKGALVQPGFPAVLSFPDPNIAEAPQAARSSGRRTVLANWIASEKNPLTARVWVNRVWQHHFGRAIVPTPNDFGKFGTLPTHPELLDWLATEFMANGWKLKPLHRLLLLSSAYQMSSAADPAAIKADPANNYFWRYNSRRLAAEEVRDSFLAVSGRLNPKMFGPSTYPPIPREVLAGQSRPGEGWGKSSQEEASRRSVYVHVKRSLLLPILSQHDAADTDSSCPVRYVTTVPTQALGMLNGEFTQDQATAFAERLRKEVPSDLAAQVRRAIRLTTGRQPTEAEVSKDVAYVNEAAKEVNDQKALQRYCVLLLNANEFVYLD